ncbi:MAG: DUF447 domain-containing protein [Planctomycetota bacterium]
MNSDLPQLGNDGLIVEGIVTTRNEDGSVNISPMGPIVNASFDCFRFRPFQSSTTYKNLKRTGRGVFHITDDVMLFAQAAVGQPNPLPALENLILRDACRWYEFDVRSLDDAELRTHVVAETSNRGQLRDFVGFNRAKHAVLEAAILATRVHLLEVDDIQAELDRLVPRVEKTASAAEQQAFSFLQQYIHRTVATLSASRSP